jgi:hypothetical protein
LDIGLGLTKLTSDLDEWALASSKPTDEQVPPLVLIADMRMFFMGMAETTK